MTNLKWVREQLEDIWRNEGLAATCLQVAQTAYESARTDGLCHEGAWECALTAARACQQTALPADTHA